MSSGYWLLVGGAALMAVGSILRFTPSLAHLPIAMRAVLFIVLVLPFQHAERSWIPWGMAVTLFGLAQVTSSGVALIAVSMALLGVIVGAVFLFWAPPWMEPAWRRSSPPTPPAT